MLEHRKIATKVMNRTSTSDAYRLVYKIEVPVFVLPHGVHNIADLADGVKPDVQYLTLPASYPDHASALRFATDNLNGNAYTIKMAPLHPRPKASMKDGRLYHPLTGDELPSGDPALNEWLKQKWNK